MPGLCLFQGGEQERVNRSHQGTADGIPRGRRGAGIAGRMILDDQRGGRLQRTPHQPCAHRKPETVHVNDIGLEARGRAGERQEIGEDVSHAVARDIR